MSNLIIFRSKHMYFSSYTLNLRQIASFQIHKILVDMWWDL